MDADVSAEEVSNSLDLCKGEVNSAPKETKDEHEEEYSVQLDLDDRESFEQELSGPDFSHLPSVAWVKILSNLSLQDRYMVSQTCHTLYDIFSHPSLWHTMKFTIVGSLSNWKYNWFTGEIELGQFMIPEKYVIMTSKFGRFFQNLTIGVSGFLHSDFGIWNDVISEVAKHCRLESLSLEVGNLTTRMHLDGESPEKKNIVALVDLVRNAFRMKSFHLISWPLFPSTLDNPEENIFLALTENSKLKDLETLSLFWCERDRWTERTPLLISPTKTLGIVAHFRNLSCLSLRSPMIDENVLQEFCTLRNSKLKLLRIFVNYNGHVQAFAIPEISVKTWESVSKVNPELSVEVTIMSRVPNEELANLLTPGCPLTKIKFLKYSRCDEQLVSMLCDRYRRTLRVFECHADMTDAERALTRLVAGSPQLDELVFDSALNYRAVMNIVSLRGKKWKKLIFECISYEDDYQDEFDEDNAIARDANGEYILVAFSKYHRQGIDDAERDRRYTELCQFMTKELGYTWV